MHRAAIKSNEETKNEQEGCAVTDNHRTTKGTCIENLHLILGQRSEQKEH